MALPVVLGATAGFNLLFTFFGQTGTNQIAVLATMAKNVLADQELPGGYTLYGVLDTIIENTQVER